MFDCLSGVRFFYRSSVGKHRLLLSCLCTVVSMFVSKFVRSVSDLRLAVYVGVLTVGVVSLAATAPDGSQSDVVTSVVRGSGGRPVVSSVVAASSSRVSVEVPVLSATPVSPVVSSVPQSSSVSPTGLVSSVVIGGFPVEADVSPVVSVDAGELVDAVSPVDVPTDVPVEVDVPPVVSAPVVGDNVVAEPESGSFWSPEPGVDYGQRFSAGDPIGRLSIPAIGVEWTAVQGVELAQLDLGPGHFPSTPLPGQPGNAALAGHRTSHGGPFRDLDLLVPGDVIVFEDAEARHTYSVSGLQVVSPEDTWVVATSSFSESTLTLTTCHPKGSTRQRLVVSAVLVSSDVLGA